MTPLPSQTVGPFFHFGFKERGTNELAGERIRLTLRLLDGAGAAVADGLFELWQADADGLYSGAGFGRLATDADGACTFETIRPGRVLGDDGVWQSAHINVIVFSRGLLTHLFTRIYFEDDPSLGSDAALELVPADRRHTLIARRGVDGGTWAHDIHLQGDDETVFFDL